MIKCIRLGEPRDYEEEYLGIVHSLNTTEVKGVVMIVTKILGPLLCGKTFVYSWIIERRMELSALATAWIGIASLLWMVVQQYKDYLNFLFH